MWQTLGQEQAVRWLQHGLATGRLAHAYVLVGPPHVGKGTLALELAQAVNCQAGGAVRRADSPTRSESDILLLSLRSRADVSLGEPCGQCRPCQRIAAGKHADVITLRREEGRAEIGIEQVREVQRRASLKPVEGRWLVCIVDGAEEMSAEAANCLLKTLEEPAPQALFLLLTSREGRLLPTVRSRCQRLALRPMPRDQVERELVRRGVEPPRAALVARLCRGRLGWAISAAQGSAEVWRWRGPAVERLGTLAGAPYSERLSYAGQWAGHFSQRREQALEEMELWQDWWRDLLLIKSGGTVFITNWDYSGQLQQQARGLSLGAIVGFLHDLRHTRQALEVNASPRLALELLMLHLPRPERVG